MSFAKWKLVLLAPIFILLTHHISFFAHEYAHAFTAWLLGFKVNPLMINYGGTNLLNLIFLINVNENVFYDMIFSQGHYYAAALIAFAGIGIGNGSLYVLSLLLLKTKSIKQYPILYFFFFWLNVMNLVNFYDYIPIRTFATHGDMTNLVQGLQISPWMIYIFLGYVIAYLFWIFFTKTLYSAYIYLHLRTTLSRASLLIACVIVIFGYFGLAGFIGYGEISSFLSATSVIIIPIIVAICWPAASGISAKKE
jgi:hypothetical protein